jgi:hypothetical protein
MVRCESARGMPHFGGDALLFSFSALRLGTKAIAFLRAGFMLRPGIMQRILALSIIVLALPHPLAAAELCIS